MEPKFQSSFIPKGPVAATNAYVAASARPHHTIFGTLATLLFTVTVILAIGLFGYDRYLLAHIGTLGSDLSDARATLQPDVIKELVRTNDRIHSTQALLARHTALTPLFDYFETATIKNVRFNKLTYTTDDKGVITLQMGGQARSYLDVALQSDAFNKAKVGSAPVFNNPVFSDLGLDTKGNVSFSFTATLNPSIVSYQQRLVSLPAQPVFVPASTSTATTTPNQSKLGSGQATSTATSTQKSATSTPH